LDALPAPNQQRQSTAKYDGYQLGPPLTSLQTDNHASTPPLTFFTDRMPFLPPNQQRQSKVTGNESVPKIIISDTINLFCELKSAFW